MFTHVCVCVWVCVCVCFSLFQPVNMSCTVMGIDSRCESSILRKFCTFFEVQSMRTTLLFVCVLGVLLCFVGSFGCFLFVLAQVFLASGGPLCAWLLFTAGPSPRLVRHFLNSCRALRSLWLVPLTLRWFLFDWFFFRKESRRTLDGSPQTVSLHGWPLSTVSPAFPYTSVDPRDLYGWFL